MATARNFCQASWVSALKPEGPNFMAAHTVMQSARSCRTRDVLGGCFSIKMIKHNMRFLYLHPVNISFTCKNLPWSCRDPRAISQSASHWVPHRWPWCYPGSWWLFPDLPSQSSRDLQPWGYPWSQRGLTGFQRWRNISESRDTRSDTLNRIIKNSISWNNLTGREYLYNVSVKNVMQWYLARAWGPSSSGLSFPHKPRMALRSASDHSTMSTF